MFDPGDIPSTDSLPTIDPVLRGGDPMGKHHRSIPASAQPPSAILPSPHSNALSPRKRELQQVFKFAIIDMVVVDRPSPKPKKRPAPAGLFVI
jgi:hypothetical protein